jgi:hypothetical protein
MADGVGALVDEERDPIPVEVVEPVKVSKIHALNGGLRLTIGYALLALGIVVGLFYGFANDRKLHDEIVTRCEAGNDLRRALQREHIPKLVEAKRNTKQFPNGGTLVLSDGKEVHFSHEQLLQTQQIEQNIINETRPINCP